MTCPPNAFQTREALSSWRRESLWSAWGIAPSVSAGISAAISPASGDAE